MFCPNCGKQNESNVKFCKECGFKFLNNEENSVTSEISKKSKFNLKEEALTIFIFIKQFVLRPIKTANEAEFNTKNSLIITGVVAFFASFANLFSSIISSVRLSKYSILSQERIVTWNWSNLGNAKLISTFFSSLIGYFIVFAFFALLFYLGSMIIKKKTNYQKLLALTSLAFLPAMIVSIFIPILNLIYLPISLTVILIISLYSFILLYEFVGISLKLEEEQKIYFFVAVISVMVVIFCFLLLKSISNEISPLINLFIRI